MTRPYMEVALSLAREGLGRTSPNPAVGAVIVRDGEVVGRGFHTWAGVKHAEIMALEEAGERARGATVYVTLEPCSHQGRTGPCADALIEAGVAKVVAAMEDPNPRVRGDGLRRLKAAGCEAKIVFLSIHEGEEFVRTAIKLGAAGYVFKAQAAFELTRAVAAVVKGKTYFPKGLASRA